MTTEAQKTALLEEFQKYLEQEHTESLVQHEQPDLNTLLGELTGLKAEVKVESRQFKNTLDTLSSALDTVQLDNKTLSTELVAYTDRHADNMRTILLEMVDIYDRLSSAVDVLQNYRPVNALFKHSQKKDIRFIKRFREGQLMTIRRFEQLLQGHQVRAIECVGKLLDPVTMSAVETGEDTKLENGIVLQELRKGFLYQDQVLRLAEVKVNKTQAG